MYNFSVLDDLKFCNKTLQTLSEIPSNLEREIRNGNNNVARVWAKDLIKESERLCKIARVLPLKFGGEKIDGRENFDVVKEQIANCWDIKVGYIKDKWLYVKMPILAPNMQGYTSDIMYEPLNLTLEKFFDDKVFNDKRPLVICYRFVYGPDIPERHYHDHDNKEIKMITDTITNAVFVDDNPMKLNNYYCSAKGEESHTEVFLIPREEFIEWLEYESTLSTKGVISPV